MDDEDYGFDNYLGESLSLNIRFCELHSRFEDEAPPPNGVPSMGWDTLVLDQGGNVLGGHHHHRQRHGIRSPFPPIFAREPLSHLGGMFPTMFHRPYVLNPFPLAQPPPT
jgi:hypothetical protein